MTLKKPRLTFEEIVRRAGSLDTCLLAGAPALLDGGDEEGDEDSPKPGREVRVGPHPHGGWQVKKAGNARATAVKASKREAVSIGRAIARKENGELIIMGANERIQHRDGKLENASDGGDVSSGAPIARARSKAG